MIARRIVVMATALAALLGLVGCQLTSPTLQATLTKMRAVAGVTKVTGKLIPGSEGRQYYTFDAALADNPTPETFVGLNAVFRDELITLKDTDTTIRMTWNQGAAARKLELHSDFQTFVPDDRYMRAIPDWPESLRLSAFVTPASFHVTVASTDATFAADLARFVAADIPASQWGAYSPRFSVGWWDTATPPIELFARVAAAAPDATKISVSSIRPDEDSIGMTWPEGSKDSALPQQHAVTDIWAAETRPAVLSIRLGTDWPVVGLSNQSCPETADENAGVWNKTIRNVEFWNYANRPGHHVTLAPRTC
jgi:hypothetical protein